MHDRPTDPTIRVLERRWPFAPRPRNTGDWRSPGNICARPMCYRGGTPASLSGRIVATKRACRVHSNRPVGLLRPDLPVLFQSGTLSR